MTSQENTQKILMGIDPGSQKTGWGLVTLCAKTRQLTHVDNGVIILDPKEPLEKK